MQLLRYRHKKMRLPALTQNRNATFKHLKYYFFCKIVFNFNKRKKEKGFGVVFMLVCKIKKLQENFGKFLKWANKGQKVLLK